MLLLCDRCSYSGQEFIKGTGAIYDNSEHEMYFNWKDLSEENRLAEDPLILVKATNKDAKEIARQNTIYFETEKVDEESLIMPEEEERRGMMIFLAMVSGGIIGKIHLQIESDQGGIYGLL